MTTEKKRVNIKVPTTIRGHRPRKDLQDPFTNELLIKVPTLKNEDILVNETAKSYFKDTCKVLIDRKQLKGNHIPIVINLANAFAVTVMNDQELVDHNYCIFKEISGELSPSKHIIVKTYIDVMIRLMALLRIEPRSEMYNALMEKTQEQGSTYHKTVQQTYDEF